jgi:WD40 repeat protein
VGAGNAKVTIAFDSWKDGRIDSTHHKIPVVAPRSLHIKLEAVSSRLKGELIHPNKTGLICELKLSPDGKRILAADYAGVVAVWDVATGKQLTTIETGSNTFAVSPDWRTLFAGRGKINHEQVEQDGKWVSRWNVDGEVRAWSLEDGKRVQTYKHQPPKSILSMRLSPDGTKFLTVDGLSGNYEGACKQSTSLWDVRSGQCQTLKGLNRHGVFSPDGKTVASSTCYEHGYTHELKLIDVASGREKWSTLIADNNALVTIGSFSRDARLIFGEKRIFDNSTNSTWRSWMKWWDTDTGREVASFDGDKDDSFSDFCFSPDGQTLGVLNQRGGKRKLFLYSIPEKRFLRTVLLCEKSEGLPPIAFSPVFSPDGKRLVVITRDAPEKSVGDSLDPRDLPQPHILLIETATGAIRETLIAPQAFSNLACFSPDGRTLVTDGHGRILLWDMTKLPD